ncbi:MAG: sugar phosphate nucleotidyltransferase [Christensenellales bacterium]
MGATLLIMAAGMGSRYGGNKQVDGLGPNGEILMEYSIYDAIRAGFDKVVFVIKPGMKETLASICGDRIAKKVKVDYAFQDFTSVPAFYHVPEERTKPFGTVHAVLVARDYIDQPFAVINADDYYGVSAFSTIYEKLQTLAPEGEATMVGYQLQNTVSKTARCRAASATPSAATWTRLWKPSRSSCARTAKSAISARVSRASCWILSRR